MKYAVIDISSCSVSLLIASVEESTKVLHHERESVSILHYTESGKLSERGLEKIVKQLNKMKEICKANGVEKCYVVSTASLRNFENYEWVASELKRRAAVNVNLLDGEEEAYCDLLANAKYKTDERSFLVDIGGGSIKLCDLLDDGEGSLTYLDFGPVQLNEKFVEDIQPNALEAKNIKDFVKKKLQKCGLAKQTFDTAVLVGTNNQGICRIYRDYYDVPLKIGEDYVDCKKLKKLCKLLVTSAKRSMLVLKNAPEKTYTLVTSAVILRTILKYFDVKKVLVTHVGVKDGYLIWVVDGKKQAVETDVNAVPQAETEKPEPPKKKTVKKKADEGKKKN